jgi:lipoate-protein ligase A
LEVRLLDTGLLSAAENMALDGIILNEVEAGRSPPTLRFLRFAPPAVLVGYNQDVAAEVRTEYCAAEGIDVNRRHTGGGAILFTGDMLGFEFFARRDDGFRGCFSDIIEVLGAWAAEALSTLGVSAAFRPKNDVEIEGRKVSGLGLAFLSKAFLFQGTVLVKNRMEEMIKSLRVPVEKLKRREIRSILSRVTFLADELGEVPSDRYLKRAFITTAQRDLGVDLIPGGLTGHEKQRLINERSFYGSADWVHRRRMNGDGAGLLRAQTGTARVALWADLKTKRIKDAVITGDFFTRPQRLVMDLETALRGASLKPQLLTRQVDNFLRAAGGEFVGTSADLLGRAIVETARRGVIRWPGFSPEELNRIYPINADLGLIGFPRPTWLLLPYCAKDLACALRHEDDCTGCGECDIGTMYDLARARGLTPVSINSFEHLMEVLGRLSRIEGASYAASCCEAFLAKHDQEMADTGVPGFVVALGSLTCYDLGKEQVAYVGKYERQSELDTALFVKTIDWLTSAQEAAGTREGDELARAG